MTKMMENMSVKFNAKFKKGIELNQMLYEKFAVGVSNGNES
jgi:hypothetical protein